MKSNLQRFVSIASLLLFTAMALFIFGGVSRFENPALAQANPTPTPTPAAAFDQAAAIAKLRGQIKGKEDYRAENVFKNLQLPNMRIMLASRLLAVMEFGYARSLGVNCTHCHTPDKWDAEDKTQKQTARDMVGMMGKINTELLKNIKNLKDANAIVNCTTCHRGQVIPVTNLPAPPKTE